MRVLSLFLICLLCVTLGLSARANTFTVTSTADTDGSTCNASAPCTLRQAITAANANSSDDTIQFDTTTFATKQTILLGGTELPAIGGTLTITGPSTQGASVTIDARGKSRIFENQGRQFTFSYLTLTGGTGYGGTIVSYGSMTIGHSVFANTKASNGGAIYNLNNLTVSDTVFSNNQASSYGGAIANYGSAVLERCLFSGNSSPGRGGTIYLQSSQLDIRDCTFIGNSAPSGAALYNDGDSGLITLDSCTIAGNTGGPTVETSSGNGSIHVKNSIIVGNGDSKNNDVVADYKDSVPYTSQGTNLIGGGNATDFFTAAGDKTGQTPVSVGLRTDSNSKAVLADNGGPTQTVALLSSSQAIDAGSTALTVDQRGVTRDKSPDIGAFEFVEVAPTVVSVSPQNASDKVGMSRTFTVSVNDGNGVTDIKDVWLLINTKLNWGQGATLIYKPNPTAPTNGILYLRRGDTFIGPITIGTGASSSDVLDNGAVHIVGNQVSVLLGTDGKTLTLLIPTLIRDGLVGQNTLFARVEDTPGAVDPASQPGNSGFVSEGIYTVTSQFANGTNNAPTLSELTPSALSTTLNSSGMAPGTQNFGFFVKDVNGTGDLDSLWFLAGSQRNWARSATFVYVPRTRRLYLRSDDGSTFLGGGQIGTAGILENSQVRVDLSKVILRIYSDGQSLGLSLPLQAKSGLVGANKVWLRVQDVSGATSPDGDDKGFALKGTWNVKANSGADAKPSPSGGGA